MTEMTLMADGFVVGRGIDDPGYVRLRFSGGDDTFNIIVPIEIGQSLAQDLDNATVQSRPLPIGPDEMKLGAVFHPIARQLRSLANGGKRLVLTVGMDDGARTIPIDLTQEEIAELISDLSKA